MPEWLHSVHISRSRMMFILLISFWSLIRYGMSIDVTERDLHNSIEKLLLVNDHLFVGTVNSLHRLSSSTLNETILPLKLGPELDNPACRSLQTCQDLRPTDNHLKILLPIRSHALLLCGTLFQGSCRIVDHDWNLIVNSSLPVVANDPTNSTIGLIVPEKNLIYFGVTYTNRGTHRWQIPNIAGRSLDSNRFMRILSANEDREDDGPIYRDDLTLRFMPRQQTSFIVQYIYSFYTNNYIYYLTNQLRDTDQTILITKIVRFCRHSSYSLIHSYSEMPLTCVNSDWIVQSAHTIVDHHHQMNLIGLFRRRDGSDGTRFCAWKIHQDIDRAFRENYRTCYSLGIGQRGLNFIKPNEPCRQDDVRSPIDLCLVGSSCVPWTLLCRFGLRGWTMMMCVRR